jgi:class 3 adenylate cyclase/predicted ATPase
MTFDEMLDQAINMLQRRGRVTYRALKAQFYLDDELLDVLKDELLFTYPQVTDENGRGLVWTGDLPAPTPDLRHRVEVERRFHTMLSAVMWWLQHERRVTYRTLKYIFGLDDALLEEIREELALRQVAIDEEGKVLVWMGEAPPAVQTAAAPIQTPALPETVTATSPAPSELAPTTRESDTPHDEPAPSPEPIRSAPDAERRQLTVMFCDLADSTKLSQQLDPEDLREVIRAYQATSAAIIQRFDGYIAQHLGDGLLIYFGWPVAHEDDAQRALHAGRGVVEAITTTLNPRLELEKGVQLTVRIGIHTGPVVVGEMGGGGRHERLATGETVNIASRLEGLAVPNAVVISQVTARLVQGAFALEDLGLHSPKGVAEPLQVFQVLGPVEAREDDEHVTAGVPFLVGRNEEIGLLLRRWGQAKEGLGQVVLISGTGGIGKSSLVEMLRHHVRDEGLPRLAFRCSPYHQNSALYPVITHVERLLAFQRDDAPATKLDKLERVLHDYSLPHGEVVPLLAELLSVPLPEGRYPALGLTPQQQRQRTHDALVAWLLAEAERQPVLAVWEDLHWADPSTLEQLGLLLEQTPTVSILNVLTFRPEFEPPWPTRSHMTSMMLNRLERPQVEALIRHLASGKDLPTEVLKHIIARTDGVPLYVEELTKMLLRSGLLREEADHYELTGPLTSVAIPDTLQDSLMARLDQLNTAKEVAQLGAVLGREFAYEMLRGLSAQDEETLQAGLAQLVEAELLYQRGRPPRAKYIFKHALIQDTAYGSLLRGARQQVHQQIAQRLEEWFPETVETQPELVAHHYTAADCPEQAIGYWQRAGQLALRRSANHEAISHLTRGLGLLATLPETPERTQQELEFHMLLGPALMATKGYGAVEVERVYNRARQLCQQVGATPHLFPVLRGLWQFSILRAELRTAYELAEQLFHLTQQEHDAAVLPEVHRLLGEPLGWLGEFAAAHTHLEQGMAASASQQLCTQVMLYEVGLHPGVTCAIFAAFALWAMGYPDQAQQHVHAALTRAQELPDPINQAFALCFAALLHQFRREEATVYARAETAIRLATEQGFAHFWALGTIYQGWALAMRNQAGTGIAQIRQGLTAYEDTGATLEQPYSLALLAEAYAHVGETEAGLTVLAEALALVAEREDCWCEAELHRLQGELLLALPPTYAPDVEACFQQALDIARQQEAKSWELRAATSLARLWQHQDKRQDASDLLAPIYGWFTEGFDTADLKDAKALLEALR